MLCRCCFLSSQLPLASPPNESRACVKEERRRACAILSFALKMTCWASVYMRKKCIAHALISSPPLTWNFQSQGQKSGQHTKHGMPRPLRGSTHNLKQGHHNHVAAACVWLLLGAVSQAQAAPLRSENSKSFLRGSNVCFSAPGIQTPTGHSQCRRQ